AQIIHDESLRMSRLVNELLDIGRMEAGHIELNITSFDMYDFKNRFYRKFVGMASDSNINFSIDVLHEESVVTDDEDRLEQVLTNLSDKAFRHKKQDGSLYASFRNTHK